MTATIANPPLSIVHIITRFIRGGADENTLLTCNGQAAAGHRVHLIVGAETHPAIIARLDERVVLHLMPELLRQIHPWKDLLAFWKCVALLRSIRPDIVHTHESKAGIVGRWAAWISGVPGIVHGVHILAFVGNAGISGPFYRLVERCTAPITNAFVDVSEGMKAECVKAGIGNEACHFVIPSGMDIDAFRSATPPVQWSEVIDEALLAPELKQQSPQFVLLASALEPRKRVIEFVSVFADVIREEPRAVLLICGDGPLMPALVQRIRDLGLAGRVLPLGHRGDLERLIALSDLCVHAAEREGLPRVIVQFVAGGKPVITTDLSGIDQIVVPGVNGHVVPSADLSKMRPHIVDMLLDLEKRVEMGRQSRSIDLSSWDTDHMVSAIERVYLDLKSGRQRTQSIGG